MPLTAQDILVQLRKLNPKANRMTIHRALEHLVKIELIHKIAFNHTYALCEHLECAQQHLCQILVCQGCGTQIELHQNHLHHALQKLGRQLDFTIANQIEITGTCLNCSLKRNNS